MEKAVEHTEFNRTDGSVLDFLLSRRSTLALTMEGPGPDRASLETILRAGARVPDHGKLAPWRFVVFEGDARAELGNTIADSMVAELGPINEMTLKAFRGFALRAPVVVAVISTPTPFHKIPVWEQQLSAGAACQNIIIAASCMEYAVQWVTGKGAYMTGVHAYLGMSEHDQIAGFIFIGSSGEAPLKERGRPDLSDIVSWR